MAKQKKAVLIREFLSQHPGASAKDVVEGLSAAGVKVSPSQVYGLRSSRKQRSKAKQDDYAPLIQAKKLADAMGGIDKARMALDTLSRLTG